MRHLKATGQRGSWFAEVGGEQLPCVHQYWSRSGKYDDPYVSENTPPWPEFLHGLHATLILELGLVAPNHLAHRRPRHRQRPHDLLDRKALLEIRPPNIADHVHGHHSPKTFPATQGQEAC